MTLVPAQLVHEADLAEVRAEIEAKGDTVSVQAAEIGGLCHVAGQGEGFRKPVYIAGVYPVYARELVRRLS